MCIDGRTNLCLNKQYIIRGCAEYAVVPYTNLYKVPQSIDFEEAALIEPIAVTLHAYTLAEPSPGKLVLIIGAGPMGLLNLLINKLSGSYVLVSDIIDEGLQKAESLGADGVINPMKEDISNRIKELNDGYGADIVIVSTSSVRAIEDGFKAVRSGGKLLIFAGSIAPPEVKLDPNYIHYNEVTITGSYDHLPKDLIKTLIIIVFTVNIITLLYEKTRETMHAITENK